MPQCSTQTAAFDRHGITDGTQLIARTHYALADSGDLDPEPRGDFLERLGMAFRRAYIHEAAVPLVPDPVNAAIEYATDRLAHRLLDRPDADLRTELLPAFYQHVAESYCAHLANGGHPGEVDIWYEDEDGDGGIPVERP